MAAARARERTLRLAVILPPLFFLAIFGYWRFLGSSACRALVEMILGRTLGARVTIGAHRIARLKEIELSDLEMEFLVSSGDRADDRPSGVTFKARRAVACAGRLLGLGPLERVVFEDPEACFSAALSSVTRLALFRRRAGRPGVKKVEFRNMAVAFTPAGRHEQNSLTGQLGKGSAGRPAREMAGYRIGGMDLELDFSGERLRMSADLGELRVEGVRSPRLERALEEERPEIGLEIEIAKSSVHLRHLSVRGRSGWKVEGDVEADLSGDTPEIRGELQLRDLEVSTIYTPPPHVTIATPMDASAAVRRTVSIEGTAEDLRVSATTDVPEFIYEDTKLGLRVEGTSLKDLRRVMRTSVTDILSGLVGPTASTGPGAEPHDGAR
jgi:hypothetical protein